MPGRPGGTARSAPMCGRSYRFGSVEESSGRSIGRPPQPACRLSTYIRNAALSVASAVDIEEARRSVEELQANLTHLASPLGAVPGATSTDRSRKRTRSGGGKRAVA